MKELIEEQEPVRNINNSFSRIYYFKQIYEIFDRIISHNFIRRDWPNIEFEHNKIHKELSYDDFIQTDSIKYNFANLIIDEIEKLEKTKPFYLNVNFHKGSYQITLIEQKTPRNNSYCFQKIALFF